MLPALAAALFRSAAVVAASFFAVFVVPVAASSHFVFAPAVAVQPVAVDVFDLPPFVGAIIPVAAPVAGSIHFVFVHVAAARPVAVAPAVPAFAALFVAVPGLFAALTHPAIDWLTALFSAHYLF